MASRPSSSSHEKLGHFNQVRDSSSSFSLCNNKGRGFSTAQKCLKRILEIISSVPPRQSSEQEEEEDKGGLRHTKEQDQLELDKDQRNAEFGSETLPFKRKTYGGSSSSSSSGGSSRDCLDLLVEAAKLISGNNTEDEEESKKKKKKKKKKEDWMVTKGLYGEGSAVVRSKRGRSQALPSRLRDSVLEPWIRLPPPPLRSTQTTRRRRRRTSS